MDSCAMVMMLWKKHGQLYPLHRVSTTPGFQAPHLPNLCSPGISLRKKEQNLMCPHPRKGYQLPTCAGPSPSVAFSGPLTTSLAPSKTALVAAPPRQCLATQEGTQGSLSCGKGTRDTRAERRKQLSTQPKGRALAGPGGWRRKQGVTDAGWYECLHPRR